MEKDELEDDTDVKDELDAEEGEPMEEDSLDDGNKDNPEAAEIREMRNRLEILG